MRPQPPVPAGPRTSRLDLVAFVILAGLVGWLAVSRLTLRTEVLEAPAAGLARIPMLWFWAGAAALGVLFGAAALFGLLRRRALPVRAFYVFAALVLFAHVFLLPATRYPLGMSGDLVSFGVLQVVAQELAARADGSGRLPTEPSLVEEQLGRVGPPPYLQRGRPLGGWSVVVRRSCEGPVSEAAGLELGTVVWCLRGDHRAGWLTVVGTGGRNVGEPAMARDPAGALIAVPVEAARARPVPRGVSPSPD